MARTLKTFTFDVLDAAGNAIPGCTVSYRRGDGYTAFYAGQPVGCADSRNEADLLSIEAANKALALDLAAAEAAVEPAQPVNVFGEPVPASSDEALARQLVGELNELEAQRHAAKVAERWQGELRAILDRYDSKSAQVRGLGFEIAPGPDGLLVLCDANRTPLHPQPATALPTTRYILRKPNGESADDDPAGVAVPAGPRPNGGGGLRMLVVLSGTARQLRDLVATASAA